MLDAAKTGLQYPVWPTFKNGVKTMPVCDGPNCSLDIPWRVTNTALQMRTDNVPFSVPNAYTALTTVLAAAECRNIVPKQRAVVFKNLCKRCWDRQAAVWGDTATYSAARAKTVPEAIYMQVGRTDFEVAGRYDKQAILSCVVHELMHYWSHAGTGLQSYNRRANVDWDEAVADILGFRVYQRMYQGKPGFTNYITPYNTYSQSLTRAGNGFGNVFGRLWREPEHCARLPKPVGDFISESKSKQPPVPLAQVKGPASERMVKLLNEYLFTWFFNGPHAWIDNGGTNLSIDLFLESNNLANMFAVSTVFQAYDGHNSLHPI
jgi:hypothetical protein